MTTGRGQDVAGGTCAQMVAGLGSSHGDDRAGWVLTEMLAECCPPGVSVFAVRTPLDVLSRIRQDVWFHLIDACDAGRKPGTLLRWSSTASDWSAEPNTVPQIVAACRAATTHDMDCLSVLELARRLQQFPRGLTVWMIQGRCFEPMSAMSAEVTGALPQAAEAVLQELNGRSARAAEG